MRLKNWIWDIFDRWVRGRNYLLNIRRASTAHAAWNKRWKYYFCPEMDKLTEMQTHLVWCKVKIINWNEKLGFSSQTLGKNTTYIGSSLQTIGSKGNFHVLSPTRINEWSSHETLPEAEEQSTSSILTACSSLRLLRAWLNEGGAELLWGVTGLSTVGPLVEGAGLSNRCCLSRIAGL